MNKLTEDLIVLVLYFAFVIIVFWQSDKKVKKEIDDGSYVDWGDGTTTPYNEDKWKISDVIEINDLFKSDKEPK